MEREFRAPRGVEDKWEFAVVEMWANLLGKQKAKVAINCETATAIAQNEE